MGNDAVSFASSRRHRKSRRQHAASSFHSTPHDRDPLSRLTTLMLVAPVTAQIVLLAVMLADGRWIFAAMVAPGLVGCLASVALSVMQRRRQTAADAKLSDAMAGPRAREEGPDAPRHAAQSIAALPAVTLESLLGYDGDPLLWRVIARRWLEAAAASGVGDGFAVPIGTCPDGVMVLDLLRQGPHALVAGTTGSGKSVLLQSWCLALAAALPPERLRFVFLDFKGGSAFRPLERLPHTVGSVCDLDLKHATRALRAIEGELVRREHLVADAGVGDLAALATADQPPRIVVVIDEFHALNAQLPDYVDRLVRIAALGRSLGMHVIACTQNPLGQVSADMKANMALNLCLRVRDGLQSSELLGSPCAAAISPSLPGGAFCSDGEGIIPLRCAAPRDIDALVRQVCLAARFHSSVPAPALFTAPLPRFLTSDDIPDAASDALPFGLIDDGVALHTAALPLAQGNIAVIGTRGRGKSTLLHVLRSKARHIPGLAVRTSACARGVWRTHDDHSDKPRVAAYLGAGVKGPPPHPHLLWLVDDADPLLDPFTDDPLAKDLLRAMTDPDITVVLAVSTPRHLKVPEHCTMRLVFPTGEKPVDLMNGVPAEVLAGFTHGDLSLPGRGVWIAGARAMPVQCAANASPAYDPNVKEARESEDW